jgi:beta-1,4-mannosyltransferase
VRLLYRSLGDLGVSVDDLSTETRAGSQAGTVDVLHVHWPESALGTRNPIAAHVRSHRAITQIDELRSHGTKLVWTAHNLGSHDRFHPRLERRHLRSFTDRVDGVIAMSDGGVDAVRRSFPGLSGVPAYVVPHGHYRDAYPDTMTVEEARRRVEVPSGAAVVGFVGSVRPYKGVGGLLRSFHDLDRRDVRLIVAGRPNRSALAKRLQRTAAGDDRIRLWLQALSTTEVESVVKASDLIVLPYRDALSSGAALLALSLGRPVLAPNLGAFADLRAEVGSAWMRTFDGALDASILGEALETFQGETKREAPDLTGRDWSIVARLTLDAYQGVLEAPQRVRQEEGRR